MLAPEQVFDKERHVGMVLDDFLIIVLQAALDVQQLGGMMAAQRVLPIPGRQFLQLFAHELQGRNALFELAKEVAEVHVGHDHVVLDVRDQGIDEGQPVCVLLGQQAIVQIVGDAVDIFAQEKTVGREIGRASCRERV